MTLKKAFQEFGVSIFTISYWLKILGYSYKKKTFPMWKQMKKSEVSIKNRSKIQHIKALYILMKAALIWLFVKTEAGAEKVKNIIAGLVSAYKKFKINLKFI